MEMKENEHSGHVPGGPEVAQRFSLLLDMFPRADGERWRGAEVEAASGGAVTGSYFSALIKGKFQRPGLVQLSALSDVIGFPFELWRLPKELWGEYLEQNPARGSFRTAAPGRPVPRVPCGAELANLVEKLFAEGSYTEKEAVLRGRGRLTVEQLERMRSGEQVEAPSELQLITLSHIFGVPYTYWYGQDSEDGRPYSTESYSSKDFESLGCAEHELVGVYRGLSHQHQEAVMTLVQHLGVGSGATA